MRNTENNRLKCLLWIKTKGLLVIETWETSGMDRKSEGRERKGDGGRAGRKKTESCQNICLSSSEKRKSAAQNSSLDRKYKSSTHTRTETHTHTNRWGCAFFFSPGALH